MNQFYRVGAGELAVREREVARYLGYSGGAPVTGAVAALVEKSVDDLRRVMRPALVWDTFPLAVAGETCTVAGTDIHSRDLARNLGGAVRVVLFAGTLGPQVDSRIRAATVTDPAAASVLQATAAMFTESFIDRFNDMLTALVAQGGGKTVPRFSPGYGDLPLETQRLFFRLLQCGKIGLSLMDTLIMAPEKSVTAFIGIHD